VAIGAGIMYFITACVLFMMKEGKRGTNEAHTIPEVDDSDA
jgi:hypothetical protein